MRELVALVIADRWGADAAISIDDIAMRAGLVRKHPRTGAAVPDRRPVEAFLEHNVDKLPFLVVAGGRGYFRPRTAAEINAYVLSIRRRHVRLGLRERAVIRRGQAAGWPRQGRAFVDPPKVQGELFPAWGSPCR